MYNDEDGPLTQLLRGNQNYLRVLGSDTSPAAREAGWRLLQQWMADADAGKPVSQAADADAGKPVSRAAPAARNPEWEDLVRGMPVSGGQPYAQLSQQEAPERFDAAPGGNDSWWRQRRQLYGDKAPDPAIGEFKWQPDFLAAPWGGERPTSLSFPGSASERPMEMTSPWDNPPITDAPVGSAIKPNFDPQSPLWDLLERFRQTRQR